MGYVLLYFLYVCGKLFDSLYISLFVFNSSDDISPTLKLLQIISLLCKIDVYKRQGNITVKKQPGNYATTSLITK